MAKQSTTSASPDVNDQLQRLAAVNGATMDIFAQACRAYVSGAAAVNEEIMSFLNTRLRHDLELSQSLAKCGNWQEAAGLQQSWLQEATEEYLAEAGKLMEVTSKVTTESWAPVQERASQALKEL